MAIMAPPPQTEGKSIQRLATTLIACSLLLGGCSTVATQSRSDDYYGASSDRGRLAGYAALEEEQAKSLFTSDSEVLSDADIARILGYRYAPQRTDRIAVVALARPYWYGWSDELARTGTEVQTQLVAKLRSSALVYDASYLPTLLIPEKRTVGSFREAAARYQADLMLIYQASCRTYDKFRFFAPDKAKSYCNVEAVLLDVRTGIVPFAVTSSRDFLTVKQESDLDLSETRRRVELEAIASALGEAGDAVVGFLAKIARG